MLKSWMMLMAASAAAPAVAGPGHVVVDGERRPTIAVSLGDLDLARPQDIERLRQRVSRAAREVCKPQTIEIPAVKAVARTCFTETRANAFSQIERVRSSWMGGERTDVAAIAVSAQGPR